MSSSHNGDTFLSALNSYVSSNRDSFLGRIDERIDEILGIGREGEKGGDDLALIVVEGYLMQERRHLRRDLTKEETLYIMEQALMRFYSELYSK